MSTAEQILVIILSSALAVFLILAITVIIMVIVLVRRLQMVASKAEGVVDAASEISQSIRKAAGSFTFFSAVRGLVDAFSHLKK